MMAEVPAPSPIRGDAISTSASLAADVQVHLQVGERHFTTTRETLISESAFFASLLSGRWSNSLPDGSYFIDADPTLFEHILRYLRRGVLPIFFDQARGHDYALYLSLLEEARYFGICRLEEWLANKRYLDVFEIRRTLEIHSGDLPINLLEGHDETLPTNTAVRYHSS